MMQSFALKHVLRLPGGIEFLLSAIASGKMLPRLHLTRGGQRADENSLGIGGLRFRRNLYRRRRTLRRDMPQFLAQYGGIDAQLLCDLLRQFVAHDAARHALNVRQKILDCLVLAFRAAYGKLAAGAIDQIVEVLLRTAQGFAVSVSSLSPYQEVGIEAGLELGHADIEPILDESAKCAFNGTLS